MLTPAKYLFLYHVASNHDPVLEYNTTNPLDLSLDNNKEGITPKVFNYGDLEGTKPANIGNNKKDIRSAGINKQKLATLNWTPPNGLLSKLLSTFKKVTFSESKFLAGTPVFDTQYEHLGSHNNNLCYHLNDQLDYTLAHYFVKGETLKCNVNRFLTNLLIKPITKQLSYCNADK